MLIRKPVLEAIRAGRITLAFRSWKRPTVKAGGRLHTAIGVLAIDAVDPVDPSAITEEEATAAGYENRSVLLDDLRQRPGEVFRITLHYAGADPRITLRQDASPNPEELTAISAKLRRMDNGRAGSWTMKTLSLIDRHPETPAATLADRMGMEKAPFKANVRKLKAMGLTESLAVGYRLSPRGRAVLGQIRP